VSVMSNQSLMSAVSDTLVSSDVQNTDSDLLITHRPVAATPKVIRKRRADDDNQPFSTTKKLVLAAIVRVQCI